MLPSSISLITLGFLNWIPKFVYQIWMADLTLMYDSAQVRESHATYLQCYSGSYGRMCGFFGDLQEIARQGDSDAAMRNLKIAEVVDEWTKDIQK